MLFNKALCLNCLEADNETVVEYLTKALLEDENPKYHHKRAALLIKQQKYQAALEDLQKSDQTSTEVKLKINFCKTQIKPKSDVPAPKTLQPAAAPPLAKPAYQPMQWGSFASYNQFGQFGQQTKLQTPAVKEFPGTPDLQGPFPEKLQEFIKYHETLKQFLNQFHSSELKEKFESVQLTVVEFQAVLWAILDLDITLTKKLNALFSLCSVKANQSLFMSVDDFCKKKMRKFYEECEGGALNEVQAKRLQLLKQVW